MLIEIDDKSYENVLEKYQDKPIVIYYYYGDFGVSMFDLEKVVKHFGDKVIFGKYNVKYSINRNEVAPCIKIFFNQKEVAGIVGNTFEEAVIEWIEEKIRGKIRGKIGEKNEGLC